MPLPERRGRGPPKWWGATMQRALFSIAAALAMCSAAFAADLPPVKAPRLVAQPLFYGGSGGYCGMGMGAEQTKLGTAAPVLTAPGTTVYAAGGLMNMTCGYTFAVGPDRWAAFEGTYGVASTDSTTAVGAMTVTTARKQSFDLTAMYGAPSSILGSIFGASPVAFGPLPAVGTTPNPSVSPFILAGVRYGQTTNDIVIPAALGVIALEEKHSKVRPKVGMGVLVQMTTDTVWRSSVDWTPGNSQPGLLFVPRDGATVRVTTGVYRSLGSLGFN